MKAIQLKREDLPYKHFNTNSLHVPVIHNGEQKFICDIHFGNDSLCYLENAHGEPTPIKDIILIQNLYHKELSKDISILNDQLNWVRHSIYSSHLDRKQAIREIEDKLEELYRMLLRKPFDKNAIQS